MKESIVVVLFIVMVSIMGNAQTPNMAERLGYDKSAKLLIIHADDLGVSHSENRASISALEESPVNSASIMVPCPWFPEIAAYARENTDKDLGLHLTLNSEWDFYKWGPVTSLDLIPSLVNASGYFYSRVDSLAMFAAANEVAIELRNQVKKAYKYGIDVTHLDAHMGAAMSTPEYLKAYIQIGQEFRLPVLLDHNIPGMQNSAIQSILGNTDVIVDHLYTAGPEDYASGMENYYAKILTDLEPGLNCLLIHLAFNDDEMKAVTKGHENWGAAWRQADYDFFTSEKCKQLMTEQKIILVSWREIRDKISRMD